MDFCGFAALHFFYYENWKINYDCKLIFPFIGWLIFLICARKYEGLTAKILLQLYFVHLYCPQSIFVLIHYQFIDLSKLLLSNLFRSFLICFGHTQLFSHFFVLKTLTENSFYFPFLGFVFVFLLLEFSSKSFFEFVYI